MKYIGPLYGKVCGKYILLKQEATEHSEVLEVPASISNPVVVDGERLDKYLTRMGRMATDCSARQYLEKMKAYLTGGPEVKG